MTFLKILTNVSILVSYVHASPRGNKSPQENEAHKESLDVVLRENNLNKSLTPPRCEHNQSESGVFCSNEGQVSSLPGNPMQRK